MRIMSEEKAKYKFIGAMALKYRLSLNSIKSIFGIKLTPLEIYEKIIEYDAYSDADDKMLKYRFLFSCDTVNESFGTATKSRVNTLKYIKQYGTILPRGLKYIEKDIDAAKTSGDLALLEKLNNELSAYKELYSEEIAYQEFKNKFKHDDTILLSQGISVISAYRIKHAITQVAIVDDLDTDRKTLYSAEKKIENKALKNKIEKLNDFVSTLYYNLGKKR